MILCGGAVVVVAAPRTEQENHHSWTAVLLVGVQESLPGAFHSLCGLGITNK